MMRFEPSKLAHLVIAYYEKFGRYVPDAALRTLGAGQLAPMLENTLITGVLLSETGWEPDYLRYSPFGCCIHLEDSEQGTPSKRLDSEWRLH